MTMSSTLRGAVLATAFGALALALAGCSSGQSSGARSNAVASLPGVRTTEPRAAAATTSDATSVAPRPRSKLFETDQETAASMVPYDNCMRAHGVPVEQGKPRNLEGVDPSAYMRADEQCADTRPLPPLEEDASNPRALGFNRAVAACIRSHGATKVSVVTSGGVINVSFDDSRSITIGLKYFDTCQRSVAARSH